MAAARSATALRFDRYSLSVMLRTIADANGDSKREFQNSACYSNIKNMSRKYEMTPQSLALKELVIKAGGPREFVDKYFSDLEDKRNDPTFVSQIINGHRPFRDVARKNMARRAGLPENYFEKASGVEQTAKTYQYESDVIQEAVAILQSLTRAAQLEALGAIKIIAAQHHQNSTQRAGQ